jgi:hypothetical protein
MLTCAIKNIPNSAKILYGTGNKGILFPLFNECEAIAQPDAPPVVDDFCYLAVELGNLMAEGDCVQKHNLDWSWASRKCTASDTDTTWKKTQCSEEYAKKWKYEAITTPLSGNDEIWLEFLNPVINSEYRIQAPCVEAIDFCYIALEEDGVTSIDQEESTDVFLTDCLN